MSADSGAPSVAVIGVHGHGRHHLNAIRAAQAEGRMRLAAVCDVRAPEDAEVPTYSDHRAMLAETAPDVVVIVTPPATHLPIASDALRSGADVLLEKPPLLSLDEHDQLAGVVAETGRVCQIGFQSLASPALAELQEAIETGVLGEIIGVAAMGTWVRTDAYYARAPWAGHRDLRGVPTGDGALTNPFAHAVMNVLALAGAPPERAFLELYRARHTIEVDDTSYLELDCGGIRCAVAVTLCAPEHTPPRIVVHGSSGQAELDYTTDMLALPGRQPRQVQGREPLLDNLIAHRADPAVPLVAPLSATRGFTAVLAAVAEAPVHPIPHEHTTVLGAGEERRVIVHGVERAVAIAGDRLTGFAAQRVDWATARPWRVLDVATNT